MDWLRGVIRIPNFFRNKASHRRNKNCIKGLEDNLGVWVTKKEDIFVVLESYFTYIFSTTLPDEETLGVVLEGIERRMTLTMSKSFDALFLVEDVKKAVFTWEHESRQAPTVFMPVSLGTSWCRCHSHVSKGAYWTLHYLGIKCDLYCFNPNDQVFKEGIGLPTHQSL